MLRRFRWRVVAAGSLFSLALGLIAAELALRALGLSYPAFWRADDMLGIALRPGAQGWFTDEGRGWVSINAHGMRDVERAVAKEPGTYRVAVLGDSYVEALQVDREKAFPAIVERKLAEVLRPRRVEVLNFGCSGYGTAQELLQLKHRVKAFAPDLVLLAFLPGNDLTDNFKELDPDVRRPYFVRRDGKLDLDASFRTSAYFQSRQSPLVNWLVDHSRIAQLANALRRRGRAALAMSRAVPHAPARPVIAPSAPPVTPATSPPLAPVVEAGLDDAIYVAPDARWTEIWRTTEALLLAMRDEARAQGARFAVVILTDSIEVHPDAAKRALKARLLGVPDLLYAARRLEGFLESNGVPALSLAQPFAAHADRTGAYLHGFDIAAYDVLGGGHWNEAGHRLAADLIVPFLAALERR